MATQIDFTVTPTNKNGNDVSCRISGPDEFMDGQKIKLPLDSGDFRLRFRLAQNGPVRLDWDDRDPFGSNRGACPAKGQQDGQFTDIRAAGDMLTVEAKGQRERSTVHYRMNFRDGSSCDPIIINGFEGPGDGPSIDR